MSLQNVILIVIGALVILLAMDSVYTVHETERAILLRFGAVVDKDVAPGLHFKLPIAEDIKKADARVLTADASPETYFTLEKKPLIVDSFAKWRIADVERFYTATSFDETIGRRILQERVNEGLRNEISSRDMHEVVSGERDKLMFDLTSRLNEVMRRDAGIEVVDVRVKRIDLPAEVSSSVYDRMNSEREIEARQYRAQGREREHDAGIRVGRPLGLEERVAADEALVGQIELVVGDVAYRPVLVFHPVPQAVSRMVQQDCLDGDSLDFKLFFLSSPDSFPFFAFFRFFLFSGSFILDL